jgi:hypothetical protein
MDSQRNCAELEQQHEIIQLGYDLTTNQRTHVPIFPAT